MSSKRNHAIFVIGDNTKYLKQYCKERSGVIRIPIHDCSESYHEFLLNKLPTIMNAGYVPIFDLESVESGYGTKLILDEKVNNNKLTINYISTTEEINKNGILIRKEGLSNRHIQYIFEKVLDSLIIQNNEKPDLKENNQYVKVY